MTGTHHKDPLAELSTAGVSVWLDDLSRELLAGGELESLIANQHVVGITTNPTIFASALANGDCYAKQLRELAASGASVEDSVSAITIADVRSACQVLRHVYDETNGVDGRVSLEVDPGLARDTAATVAQARALWESVDQPNLLIKIPATTEGLAAITAVIGDGISVNVTLIFPSTVTARSSTPTSPGSRKPTWPDMTSRRSTPSHPFSSRASTPRSMPASTPSAPRKPLPPKAKPRSRMRAWPSRSTNRRWRASAGSGSRSREHVRSGRCGPPPESRPPTTPTRCTYPRSSPRER